MESRERAFLSVIVCYEAESAFGSMETHLTAPVRISPGPLAALDSELGPPTPLVQALLLYSAPGDRGKHYRVHEAKSSRPAPCYVGHAQTIRLKTAWPTPPVSRPSSTSSYPESGCLSLIT